MLKICDGLSINIYKGFQINDELWNLNCEMTFVMSRLFLVFAMAEMTQYSKFFYKVKNHIYLCFLKC